MPAFDETMTNSRIFLTYSLAMSMLGKSAQMLAERGADPKAMSFITMGIELLAGQLRDYADLKESEEETEAALNRLCRDVEGITRAPK